MGLEEGEVETGGRGGEEGGVEFDLYEGGEEEVVSVLGEKGEEEGGGKTHLERIPRPRPETQIPLDRLSTAKRVPHLRRRGRAPLTISHVRRSSKEVLRRLRNPQYEVDFVRVGKDRRGSLDRGFEGAEDVELGEGGGYFFGGLQDGTEGLRGWFGG